jgi:hypothetical protein
VCALPRPKHSRLFVEDPVTGSCEEIGKMHPVRNCRRRTEMARLQAWGIYVDSIPIATLEVLHRALQKGNRYPGRRIYLQPAIKAFDDILEGTHGHRHV